MAEMYNKNQEMYKDYIRKTEASPYVGRDPFAGTKPTAVTVPDCTAKASPLRPAHYGCDGNVYEVFNVLEAWGLDKDAYIFNVVKYVARAGKKDQAKELEDLKKAAFYLDRKIKNLEL